jgi:hypothetical protein
MVRGSIYGRRIQRSNLGRTAVLFRNAGEPLQSLRVHHRKFETNLRAVIEEEGVEDFANSDTKSEAEVRDAEERLDIRDLLLDETD